MISNMIRAEKPFLCLVVGGGESYFIPANHIGLEPTSDIDALNGGRVKLAIFTGGEDVDPSLYKHPKYIGTFSSLDRDTYEQRAFAMIREKNIPMLGICRGAQLLCALAGGSLVQDVTGHGRSHLLRYLDSDGKERTSFETVTSTHHQQQYPWDLPKEDFKVLAWSPEPISNHYVWKGKKHSMVDAAINPQFRIEPDVVFYPKINALAIQYHPEWMGDNSWGMKYARGLIGRLMEGRL